MRFIRRKSALSLFPSRNRVVRAWKATVETLGLQRRRAVLTPCTAPAGLVLVALLAGPEVATGRAILAISGYTAVMAVGLIVFLYHWARAAYLLKLEGSRPQPLQ